MKNKIKASEIEKHKNSFDKVYEENPFIREILSGSTIDDPVKWTMERNPEIVIYFHNQFNNNIYNNLDIENGSSILNVGCLAGYEEKRLKILFSTFNLNLFGVDISKTGIMAANRNNPVASYSLALAEALPFPSNCFDNVFSREVIEHVIDPEKMLAEIYRVLKPGGRAIITTPNAGSLFHLLMRLYEFFIPGKEHDYKDEHMNLSRISGLLGRTPFRVVKRILDGQFYFFSMIFKGRSFLSKLMLGLVRAVSVLNSIPLINVLLCDQVKYILSKPDTGAPLNEVHYICPKCGKKLSPNNRCSKCRMNFYDPDAGAPDFII